MSDKDMAQLNAIIAVYTAVLVLLCWWHVLHAWQQHFNPKDFPELWDLLKKWIRMTDKEEFLAAREKIRTLAPNSFDDYLEKNWMNCEYLSSIAISYACGVLWNIAVTRCGVVEMGAYASCFR